MAREIRQAWLTVQRLSRAAGILAQSLDDLVWGTGKSINTVWSHEAGEGGITKQLDRQIRSLPPKVAIQVMLVG